MGLEEAAAAAEEAVGSRRLAAQAGDEQPSLAQMTVLEKPEALAQPRWHSRKRRAVGPAQADGDALRQPQASCGTPQPTVASNLGAGSDASRPVPETQPEMHAATDASQADVVQKALAELLGRAPVTEVAATPGALLELIQVISSKQLRGTPSAAHPEVAQEPQRDDAQPAPSSGLLPALGVQVGGSAEHGAPAACKVQGGPRTPSPRSRATEEFGEAPAAAAPAGESRSAAAAVSSAERAGAPGEQRVLNAGLQPVSAAAARDIGCGGMGGARVGGAPAQRPLPAATGAVPFGSPAAQAPPSVAERQSGASPVAVFHCDSRHVPVHGLSRAVHSPAAAVYQVQHPAGVMQEPRTLPAISARAPAQAAGPLAGPAPAAGQVPDEPRYEHRRAEGQTPDQALQRREQQQAGRGSSGGGSGKGLWGLAVPIMEAVALRSLEGERSSTPRRQARTRHTVACLFLNQNRLICKPVLSLFAMQLSHHQV